MNRVLQDITAQVGYAQRALNDLKSAKLEVEVRDAWETYLMRFSRAIGKLISSAIKNPSTKEFGHQLKNNSTKNDQGLLYLREARNVDDHGIDLPAAKYSPASFDASNILVFDENTDVTVGKIVIDGKDMGGLRASRRASGDFFIQKSDDLAVTVEAAKVALQTVHNPEKNLKVDVPASVFDVELTEGTALELAEKSLFHLRAVVAEYEQLIAQN